MVKVRNQKKFQRCQLDMVWEKRYGGAETDYGNSIKEIDNGFLVNAGTKSFGAGEYDAWILRLDTQGNVVWQKRKRRDVDNFFLLLNKFFGKIEIKEKKIKLCPKKLLHISLSSSLSLVQSS